jgi:hypothetical protein
MRGANEVREQLLDLVNGRSALQVHLVAAASAEPDGNPPSAVAETVAQFESHKSDVRNGLLRRVEDLKPYLDDAIDKVEEALEIEAPVKAAGRHFVHTETPDRIQ